MNYILHILVMIAIYIILSLSLNLLLGYTGLVSLSHGAFYGIGAYAYALLLIASFPWFLSMILSVLFVGILALTISVPTLRLRGDYFILGTIGFQMIVYDILNNWMSVTRGPYGISGIQRFSIAGSDLASIRSNFVFIASAAIIVSALFYYLGHSVFGRLLKGIREDELAIQALGKSRLRAKIWAFVLASSIAALAGCFYASYITYIDPASFTLDESIFILAILLVGGSGNIVGPILGSIVLVILPEVLRFMGMPSTIAPNMRQIVYGLFLILILFFRPKGIAGEYGLD